MAKAKKDKRKFRTYLVTMTGSTHLSKLVIKARDKAEARKTAYASPALNGDTYSILKVERVKSPKKFPEVVLESVEKKMTAATAV